MSSELADQFDARWKSSDSAPDVFAFLAEHTETDRIDKLTVLLCDQKHRWRVGEPLSVEQYLSRLPELAQDAECKLQLAVGEYQVRQKSANWPSVQEFAARFSDISEPLRRKLLDAATVARGVDGSEFGETLSVSQPPVPTDSSVGRYRILRIIGEGSFGRVYLGFDDELQRPVAIKVPNPERFQERVDADAFLAEARTVAGLDHPNIVPVYDIGRTEDGRIYVVSRYIEGSSLGERLREQPFEFPEATQLLAAVARGLQHAHENHVIHRDIKPGNILLEAKTGTAYVADFGLALHEKEFLTDGRVVGTPSYMSPEQARGEGHRLDGRSDIFSLGAVFYRMLTLRKPFEGHTTAELLHSVISVEPQAPRELNEAIPAELERICLKALSKRASDRYATASEFADDLLRWQQTPAQKAVNRQITPHGLRSFDASDADVFLELLPGPRNREGLPESIQFWKTRLEETDSDLTFPVGLIYGPSGCGKSSLVKAGLLPRLAKHVRAVYLEATPADTEARILRGIRKYFPEISTEWGLVQTLQFLRKAKHQKVVLVIDQFEQWLHSNQASTETDLVAALRQCDGGSLQAVVMVRDDFAMAAARFMDALDIPIVQSHNFATVDLFDEHHAKMVLARFGQAFGKLPLRKDEFTAEQSELLAAIVDGLATNGKVVPVQLALLAEMIKFKPWTSTTLQQVGGTAGIGVNFLEENFSSRSANPTHVQHQRAARDVLKALLPEVGSDIKGHMRSQAELLQISGYLNQPRSFNELLRVLDGELRLMTPTDPDGLRSDSGSGAQSRHYQLTHDYLVPMLREWLTRKQTETQRGRIEILLQDRTSLWSGRREQKQLPSLIEWLGILHYMRRSAWSATASAMMRAATRLYLTRLAIGLALAVVICVCMLYAQFMISHRTRTERISNLVDDLWQARIEHVPAILSSLAPDRSDWIDRARQVAESPASTPAVRARAYLAVSEADRKYLPLLVDRLLECDVEEHAVVRSGLANWSKEIADETWSRMENSSELAPAQLIRAGVLLAAFSPKVGPWDVFGARVVDALVRSDPFVVKSWVDGLAPVRSELLPRLTQTCRDENIGMRERSQATSVIAIFARTGDQFPEAAELLELALTPDPTIRATLEDVVLQRRESLLPFLLKEISLELGPDESARYQTVVIRKALAIEIAQRLGHDAPYWQHLNEVIDPRVRTVLINDFGQAALNWKELSQRLRNQPPVIRQAILLGLPQILHLFSEKEKVEVGTTMLDLYRTDPDAGVHSAAEFGLRAIGSEETVNEADVSLAKEGAKAGNWSVLPNGLCMVSLERAGLIAVGSRTPESDLDGRQPERKLLIDYPFEISATEITVRQFQQFRTDLEPSFSVTSSVDCPMNRVDLFSAMRFCRRLSEQEPDFDPARCVYPPVETIGPGLLLAEDYLRWPGFRLPSVLEWEHAARCGAVTNRFFGDAVQDLDAYCWWVETSQERLWPVGRKRPNFFGLFDVHGNVSEWCHEADVAFDSSQQPTRGGDYRSTQRFLSPAFPTNAASTSLLSTNGFRIVRIKADK